jgi:hypothetical protein
LCIEYSADCNNDGIVDKGQILDGQLADCDDNGVPDLCQPAPCGRVTLVSQSRTVTARIMEISQTESAPGFGEWVGDAYLNDLGVGRGTQQSTISTSRISAAGTVWAADSVQLFTGLGASNFTTTFDVTEAQPFALTGNWTIDFDFNYLTSSASMQLARIGPTPEVLHQSQIRFEVNEETGSILVTSSGSADLAGTLVPGRYVLSMQMQIVAARVPGTISGGGSYSLDLQFASPCTISQQPTSISSPNGSTAQFSVGSSSPSATTHLWHRNGLPLANNARISGADTPTLTISNSQWSDQGAYTCLVSGNCGSVMSDVATLTITSCPPAWTSTGTEDFGARWVHAQAYSGVNGGTLIFGGRDASGATLGDTWLRSDSGWANVATTGPAARTDHAMATLANGRILLFGGKTDAAVNSSAVADTWEWNGSEWTLLSNSGPAARAGHTLAFDSARNRLVLFGGLDANGAVLGDTWEWTGNSWTQAATTGPSPRFAHTMAYDPARQRTILFGGFGPGLLGDTWEWDGTAWTQAATTGVSARFYAAAAFDASLGRVLLLGGSTGGTVLNDAYAWTGTAWQPQSFTTSPTPRWTHAMSYDAAAGRMVITGGAGTGATRFSDAWESSGRPMTTTVPPIALSRMAGDAVQLATPVGGTGPFTYRWKKDGANLFNSALYSGVTTSTLTINTTDPSQSGLYTLAITSPCTALTTTGTLLDIRCGADFNNDGAVDGDDVIGFFTDWDAGDLAGDYNTDGSVDGDDVIGFFGRWDVGC